MNWEEFLVAKEKLIGGGSCPSLMMSGVMFDNGTRYLETQKGKYVDNTDTELFDGFYDSDFVWNGRKVRIFDGLQSGGHPALAGFDSIYCAGEIHNDGNYFFFKSGHFHPKRENAIYFICDFIEKSCVGLHGMVRDAKVDELSKIRLKLYHDHSETSTYFTTFADIAGQGSLNLSSSSDDDSFGSSMIPRSKPMKIGSSMGHSQPIPIGKKSQPISISGHMSLSPPLVTLKQSSLLSEGISEHGKHLTSFRVRGVPNWVPDSDRTRCRNCNKAFGALTWKHHCRQCGDIFCDACSKKTKQLLYPARRGKDDHDAGPYRVCDPCSVMREL